MCIRDRGKVEASWRSRRTQQWRRRWPCGDVNVSSPSPCGPTKGAASRQESRQLPSRPTSR
eukprot:10423951-Prorocentrum_lima.AAC.1